MYGATDGRWPDPARDFVVIDGTFGGNKCYASLFLTCRPILRKSIDENFTMKLRIIFQDEKWFLVPWIIVRSIYLIILLILMVVIPLYFKPALSVWLLTLESFVVQKPNSYAEEMFVAPSRVSFGISPKMVHSPSIAENGTEETFDDVTSSPGSPFDVLLTYSKIIHLVSIIVTEIVLLIVFGK